MTITRLGGTKGLEPRITVLTIHVLHRIDAILAAPGTNKSQLLSGQVWVAAVNDFQAHDRA